MNIGLPTTGLGGIFYMLCGLGMPLVEIIRTFFGKSSLAKWRVVLTQTGITVGILCMTGLTSMALHYAFPGKAMALLPMLNNQQYGGYVTLLYTSPLLFLGAILFLSWLLGLVMRRSSRVTS